MTPKKIVQELDRYVVGQEEAKRCVAVALRNRYRRKKLPPELREEVAPKNIIMIGPTGIGKTEIARRLARLVNAPFIKVEATKYTEVGYVGRDVESMVRELLETAVHMVRSEKRALVEEEARQLAEQRIAELLVPPGRKSRSAQSPLDVLFRGSYHEQPESTEESRELKEARRFVLRKLREGKLEDEIVEIEVEDKSYPVLEVFSPSGIEEMGVNLQDVLGGLFPRRKKKRRVAVREARKIIAQEEADKLVDTEEIVAEAIRRTEEDGIIFIDEIDKIARKEGGYGPDVSREGVQRDILPLVEGCTVNTKYGPVKTDHILFIAAGAFHMSKPSDLIPELQGRFPIRVELNSLTSQDFIRILTEPENALIKQYTALLEAEGVRVMFTPEAISRIAEIAYEVNTQTENIGARRLHTVLEKVLQDLFFEAPDVDPEIVIDTAYVESKLHDIIRDRDLSRYIL